LQHQGIRAACVGAFFAGSGLIGTLCTVEQTGARRANDAWVRVEGELWRAVSSTPLEPAQQVRSVGRDGLTLEGVPADGGREAAGVSRSSRLVPGSRDWCRLRNCRVPAIE